MRLVLDTNVVVAGLLWHGTPRTLLALAFDDAVTLYSSQVLVEECGTPWPTGNSLRGLRVIKPALLH